MVHYLKALFLFLRFFLRSLSRHNFARVVTVSGIFLTSMTAPKILSIFFTMSPTLTVCKNMSTLLCLAFKVDTAETGALTTAETMETGSLVAGTNEPVSKSLLLSQRGAVVEAKVATVKEYKALE